MQTGGALVGSFEKLILSVGYEVEIIDLLPIDEVRVGKETIFISHDEDGSVININKTPDELFIASSDISARGECYSLKDPFLHALHQTDSYYIKVNSKMRPFEIRAPSLSKVPHVEFMYTFYKPTILNEGMLLHNYWHVLDSIKTYLLGCKIQEAHIVNKELRALRALDDGCGKIVPTFYKLLKDTINNKYFLVLQDVDDLDNLRLSPQTTIGTKLGDFPALVKGLVSGRIKKDIGDLFGQIFQVHRQLLKLFNAATRNDSGYLFCIATYITRTSFDRRYVMIPIRHHLCDIRHNTEFSESFKTAESLFIAGSVADYDINIYYNDVLSFTKLSQLLKFVNTNQEELLDKTEIFTLTGSRVYKYENETLLFEYRYFRVAVREHYKIKNIHILGACSPQSPLHPVPCRARE
jgi:hypothetical protein